MVHDHILERGGAFRERGAALRALINAGKAYQEGVPVSEYVRGMVHDHILQMGARFREAGARLRTLSNAVKAWLIAYHECVTVAAGLPGKERRAELVSRSTWLSHSGHLGGSGSAGAQREKRIACAQSAGE